MQHIPNILSTIRFLLAFVFPFVEGQTRLVVVVIALLTEFFDGYLARKFDWVSKLGTLLDPIADKTFVISLAFTLFVETDLTWYELLFFGSREVTIMVGVVSISLKREWSNFLNLKPLWSGKLTTCFQFACFINYLLLGSLYPPLLYSTMLVSFASAMEYMVLFFKTKMFKSEHLSVPDPMSPLK